MMKDNGFKRLFDYKEEIHRCSKCGLCQAACPLYQQTGNECTVSRGQFIMLDGVIKNKLKLSKNINKYLDLCLKCNKCSEHCPSNIDVVDILISAKYEYFKNSFEGKIYSFLESKFVFGVLMRLIKTVANLFVKKYKSEVFDTKAVYFGGCISALKPGDVNYAVKLLNRLKIEVVDTHTDCCGMPFLTTGNLDRFCETVEDNIRKIPDDVKLVIVDCASCEWAWNQYNKYVKDDVLREKLNGIKVLNLYKIISENGLKFRSKDEVRVTYHKPCHEHNDSEIERLVKNIENCRYVEMKDYDKCCGFASFEHPYTLKRTAPVREEKKKNIESTEADIVLTSCVGCMFSLGLISKKKVCRLISFLKDKCYMS